MNRRFAAGWLASAVLHVALLLSPSLQTKAEFAVDPGRARVEVQLRPKRKPVVKRRPEPKKEKPVVEKKVEPEPTPKEEPVPPPPMPEEGAIVDAKPDYLRNPPPVYPESARRRGIEGLVLLFVEVAADGRPKGVRIETSSGSSILDEAAVRAVERWRFKPGTLMGVPTSSRVRIPIRFRLDERF